LPGQLPKPANLNIPKAANDNVPAPLRPKWKAGYWKKVYPIGRFLAKRWWPLLLLDAAWTAYNWFFPWGPNRVDAWNTDGYYLYRDCGLSIDGLGGNRVCGLNLWIEPGVTPFDYFPPPSWPNPIDWDFYHDTGYINPITGLKRWKPAQWWRKDNPTWTERSQPRWVPGVWIPPTPVEVPAPAIDPMSLPIHRPITLPRAIPWPMIPHRQPNPWRNPREQTRRGHGRSRARPYRWQDPTVPSERFTVDPGGDPRRPPDTVTGPYTPKPPPPGTKERKFIATAHKASWIGWALNGVTEGLDIINALHRALPKQYRTKGADQTQRMRDLYEHFNEIEVSKAIEEIVKNEIEDRIFGGIGRLGAKAVRANPYYKSPVGIQTGPLF
jgi:hypothetical protein